MHGDITPLTKPAKAFSVVEVVIGRFYLVVARFVGMHLSRKSGRLG